MISRTDEFSVAGGT